MSAFLLWWASVPLKTKIYAVLIFSMIIGSITFRGITCLSQFVHQGGYDEVQDVELSPGSAYDHDCVPESGKSCP
ncbi:hypothetical protein [Leptospira weilii]|uniref:hypothetical protein n=1 Tax=Leptospira weilii TaxID=28184 RepID=UPI0002FA6CAC|nr:hypothetical protein [Leptospira weilii]